VASLAAKRRTIGSQLDPPSTTKPITLSNGRQFPSAFVAKCPSIYKRVIRKEKVVV
jgi:hypothetical protein